MHACETLQIWRKIKAKELWEAKRKIQNKIKERGNKKDLFCLEGKEKKEVNIMYFSCEAKWETYEAKWKVKEKER